MKGFLLVAVVCLIRYASVQACDSRADCNQGVKQNEVCVEVPTFTNFCSCPPGLIGDACQTRDPASEISPSCTLPPSSGFADICQNDASGASCVTDGCTGDDAGKICCVAADGCSAECIFDGCDNPVNAMACKDQGKVCVKDTTTGFRCECPSGYTGDDCMTRTMIDEKCDYPDIDQVCDIIAPPVCRATVECNDDDNDDKICCSTGCGTACVDKKKSGLDVSNLITILILQQFLPGMGSRPPPSRCPQCQECRRYLCHNDMMAGCQDLCPTTTRNYCDVAFYDRYITGRRQYINNRCFCPPGRSFAGQACTQQWSYCENYECADRRLRCHVSGCGGCNIYWAFATGDRGSCPQVVQKQRGLFGNIFGGKK